MTKLSILILTCLLLVACGDANEGFSVEESVSVSDAEALEPALDEASRTDPELALCNLLPSEYDEDVKWIAGEWERGTGVKITFDCEKEGALYVVNGALPGTAGGVYLPSLPLIIVDVDATEESEIYVGLVFAHELGHALGVSVHSEDEKCLMFHSMRKELPLICKESVRAVRKAYDLEDEAE